VHANKDLGLDLNECTTRFLICICGHNTITVLLCRQLWVSAHSVIFNFVYTVQAHATEQAETRPMTCTRDTHQGTERTQEKELHILILLTMLFMYYHLIPDIGKTCLSKTAQCSYSKDYAKTLCELKKTFVNYRTYCNMGVISRNLL